MQLISLTLNKHRIISFGLHETITYVPSAIEQVILGCNGSGKSTLLGEIYNIVPSGDMYLAGGGKEYVFQHGDKIFKATSVFKNKAGHHSFCISSDGEEWIELNESGLQTDQYMLVKEYTGLDQELVDLSTGASRLSKMDPNTRRKWLMRICGTDFGFINDLHSTFKKRHRDYKGTVDTLSESLADTIKDLELIAGEVGDQSIELNDLQTIANNISSKLEKIGGTQTTVEKIRGEISQLIHRIEGSAATIAKLNRDRDSEHRHFNIASIEEAFREQEISSSHIKGQQKALQERLMDVQLAIDSVGRENLKEPTAVLQRLEAITSERIDLESQVTDLVGDLEFVSQCIHEIELAIRRLEPVLCEMPYVESTSELKQQAKTANERQLQINKEIEEINKRVQSMAVRIEHYEHTDSVDCPNCSTRFKPGLDDRLIAQFKESIGALKTKQMELLTESAELNQTLEKYNQVVDVLRQYKQVTSQHLVIDSFWRTFEENKTLFTSPGSIITTLSGHVKQLYVQQRYLRLKTEEEKLLNIKASLENDTGHLLETAERLESQLFELESEETRNRRLEERYRGDLKLYDKCCEEVNRFNKDLARYVELTTQLQQATVVGHLQGTRNQVTTRIGTLHSLQAKHKGLVDREAVLQSQIASAKSKFEVYKALDKATSPTEGVVANIIKGFMERFLNHMNTHLAKVWSYDLILEQLPDKGQPFTCQFPLFVDGAEKPVPDFKGGSTGQVSMIDFAFKLVVFKLLGLNDMPLLADEFGKDFDDEHRERLVNYIRDMIEEKQFSQLFMVSHYSSVYNSLAGSAEFVVLNDRNITKPSEYNTGITFR